MSDRDTSKTCTATCSDGSECNAYAVEGKDVCYHHGGASTGAPKGNQNRTTHGLRSDPTNLLEHLRENDEKGYAWIQDKFESYLKVAPFERDSAHADQLLQVCVREFSIWKANKIQINKGIITKEKKVAGEAIIQVDVENPANKAVDRMERTVVKRLEKLGVMPSPEQQKANAQIDMGSKIAEALEED